MSTQHYLTDEFVEDLVKDISANMDYVDGVNILNKIVENMYKISKKFVFQTGNVFAMGEVYKVLDEADKMIKKLENPDDMTPEIQEKLFFAASLVLMIAQKEFQISPE